MRLSEWRAGCPAPGRRNRARSPPSWTRVLAFGAEPDPHCWVAWGEEPAIRFTSSCRPIPA